MASHPIIYCTDVLKNNGIPRKQDGCIFIYVFFTEPIVMLSIPILWFHQYFSFLFSYVQLYVGIWIEDVIYPFMIFIFSNTPHSLGVAGGGSGQESTVIKRQINRLFNYLSTILIWSIQSLRYKYESSLLSS